MQWTTPVRGDIRRVVDRAHLYNRIINNNRIIIDGFGSPVTYWRNTSINKIGQMITTDHGGVRCYCWDVDKAQGDKRHSLCQGTGWISHLYQKYGYTDTLWATPSHLTLSTPSLIKSGSRNSAYSLSGTTLSGDIITDKLVFDKFREITHVLIQDFTDKDQNRIEYYYTIDDITWVQLTPVANTVSKLSNQIAYFTLPTTATWIKFKATLKRRTVTSPSPSWNSIRLRYRYMVNLYDMDDRFPIHTPAFLAARNNAQQYIEQGEAGIKTVFPYKWWVMPEAHIEETDIIMFLIGEFANLKFEVKNLSKYAAGPYAQVTHKDFETRFIRDGEDLLGIVDLLI